MEDMKEKFTIKVTDRGLLIDACDDEGEKRLRFTAGEALMLLDILKNEESKLQEMADASSPMPLHIRFGD